MKTKIFYWVSGVLLLFNVLLMVVIYSKTNLFQRIGTRLGLYEPKPQDNSAYWCIRGWTNTLEKLNVDCDVVFFGNSITCGSSFHDYFPSTSIVNLGYPGDNLDGMILRVNQIRAVNPKKIFVMAGINGLNFQALEVFEEKYKRLVKSIKESNPNTIVYLQSILPVNNSMAKKIICSNDKIKDANIIIRNIANNNECIYLDIHHLYVKDGEMNAQLSRDGVHLLPQSYKAWADFLKPYIEGNDIITQ